MAATKTSSYTYAVGRRKQSTATVKLYAGGNWSFTVMTGDTSVSLKDYFGGREYMYENATYPLITLGDSFLTWYNAEIKFVGGGTMGQSESLKLAFARALIQINPEFRLQLKPFGLLKRDPRRKERKKPGLRGARRSPQWSKR
jgi:small subunit ribosomal protein S9